MAEPICCVTGQIAGHPDACHDCDPCLASGSVSEPVKRLIKEVTEWRDKYADAAVQLDEVHLFEDQMRAKLLSAVRAAGSQKAWATANGISPAYVNDCLNRGKPIGAAIAKALGYRPETVYLPIKPD